MTKAKKDMNPSYSKVSILKGLRARLHKVRNDGDEPLFILESMFANDKMTPDTPGYDKLVKEYYGRMAQEELLFDMIRSLGEC